MKKCALVLSAMALCLAADGGELVLAARGRAAEYAIVRAADASPSIVYAAEELRDFTERMTGVRLAIVDDGRPLPEKAIVLGFTRHSRSAAALRDAQASAQGQTADGLGEDGFRLVARPPHLIVEGSDVRGVLYGVYELLERFGGCRWYASWHTVVPARGSFAVPDDLDDRQTPAFLCRDVHWWDFFKGDFAARDRANGISNGQTVRHGGNTWRFGGGLGNCHTFERLLPPDKYFDAHPEYYSFVNGKRLREKSQLCLTNPDVLRIVTSNVLERIRKDPGAKFYGVSQNDWFNYCECPKCKAVDDEEGSHAGTMVRFVNAIAEAVEREFPGKMIETLAYLYTRQAPKKTKLRHNVVPCLCSIECDFSRPIDKSPFSENVRFVKDIQDWSRQTDFLYVWDYVTDFRCYPHPFPNVYTLQENVKFFRYHGVKMLFEQGGCQGRHAGFAELKGWLLAKWMWNPDLPAGPLLDDFFAGYYGKAAPFVRAVFDEAHRRETAYVGDDPSRTLKIYEDVISAPCRAVMDDAFVAWAQAQMKKAEAAVAAEPAVYSYNVRMTAFSFDYIRLERLQRGVLLDFTAPRVQNAAAAGEGALSREEEMQSLARSLLARMDEAKDIRLSSGDVKAHHDSTVGRWKSLAQSDVVVRRRAPAPFGTIPESAFNIAKKGVWADYREDASAEDGCAVRISNVHFGWCVTFQLDSVTFRPGKVYSLKARVRVERMPGAAGNAFWAGVYSNKDGKSRGEVTVKTSELVDQGYAWYDIVDWRPGEKEYFWIGLGPFNKTAGASVESVWVDEIRIEEKNERDED